MSSALVLQRVGLELVAQADAAALVAADVDDDARALGGDQLERALELLAAVAAAAAEDVAGEALGVDAHEHVSGRLAMSPRTSARWVRPS